MRILITAATALPLLLTSLTLTLAPTAPAYALPTNSSCLVTTYYNNASHDEGRYRSGQIDEKLIADFSATTYRPTYRAVALPYLL